MKTLKWFVPPFLTIAVVGVLLSQSAAGDVIVEDSSRWQPVMDISQRTALAQLVGEFWNGPIERVELACFARIGSNVFVQVSGVKQLDADGAWERLQAGYPVRGNLWTRDDVDSVALTPAQRTALVPLVSALWDGNPSLIRRACWRSRVATDRMGAHRIIQGKVWGAKTINKIDAIAAWVSGKEIVPIAVVE